MAGKLHKDFVRYRDGGGQVLSPFGKRYKAYAEGYNARRGGALQASNPLPAWQSPFIDSDWACWDQGWRDGDAKVDPTHVGGTNVFT